MMRGMSARDVFDADMDRFDVLFRGLGAIVTHADSDGEWSYINREKVPAAGLHAYNKLIEYGFANGLID